MMIYARPERASMRQGSIAFSRQLISFCETNRWGLREARRWRINYSSLKIEITFKNNNYSNIIIVETSACIRRLLHFNVSWEIFFFNFHQFCKEFFYYKRVDLIFVRTSSTTSAQMSILIRHRLIKIYIKAHNIVWICLNCLTRHSLLKVELVVT